MFILYIKWELTSQKEIPYLDVRHKDIICIYVPPLYSRHVNSPLKSMANTMDSDGNY